MYYDARDRFNDAPSMSPARAAYFFLVRQLAYGGMFRVNANGYFNVPFGRAYAFAANTLRDRVAYLQSPAVQDRMRLLQLSAQDFEEFMARFDLGADDFVFLDPPYDSSFSTYHQDFTSEDHARLAACVEAMGCNFMLVIKVTPLIESLYLNNGYSVQSYEMNYRFNIKGRFSREATHVLVTNYEMPNVARR